METTNYREEYISAISRLFILSSNKRNQIKDSNINLTDAIGKISVDINSKILKKTNIDIFKGQNLQNILLYENELNNLFTEYSNINIIEGVELEDEITLLKSYEKVENDYFLKNKLTINNKITKDFIRKLPITIPTIIGAATNPDYLHLIKETDFGNNYFATSIVRNNILIYHLVQNRDDKSLIDFHLVLSFKISKYKDLVSNPTRLFLNVLDDYGIDITINNTTRRFFKHAKVLNENVKGDVKFIEARGLEKVDFEIQASIMKTEYGGLVKYAYGINNTLYTEDVLKNY